MYLGLTAFFAVVLLASPKGRFETDGNLVMLGLGAFMLGLSALTGANRNTRPVRSDDSEELKGVAGILLGWVFIAGAIVRIAVDLAT